MRNIETTFNPTQNHLDDIEKWMVEEKKIPISENGNWTSVIDAFQRNTLIVATLKNETIGFYALRYTQSTLIINVAEVKPNYRRKGVGRLLLKEIIEKYKNEEVFVLKLHCSPKSTHLIWRDLGFEYFPDSPADTSAGKIEMYKIIKPLLSCLNGNLNPTSEVVEIWDNEPGYTNDNNPTWVWKLEYLENSNILKKPIVHFGHYKWRVRWRKGDDIFRDCRYEYFDMKNEVFYCMIIKETPIL